MKKTENLTSFEVNFMNEIKLTMSGLLNYEMYVHLETEEVQEFVSSDIKRRVTDWVKSKFKDDPFAGTIFIEAVYNVLDCRYNTMEIVNARYIVDFEDNNILEFNITKITFNPVN